MSSRFPGSVVLLQEAIGVSHSPESRLQDRAEASLLILYPNPNQHTVVDQGGSICYFGHVQAYFQGVVPSGNTTCPQQFTPFMD